MAVAKSGAICNFRVGIYDILGIILIGLFSCIYAFLSNATALEASMFPAL